MSNEREHFKDDTFDLAKALYHVSIAKQYFEMIRIDKGFAIKALFSNYISRLDWVVNNIYDRLGDEGREYYKKSIKEGDTVFFAEISNKLIHLTEENRAIIESLVNSLVKGETIKIEKQ